MHLVQLLLPLRDNRNGPFPASSYDRLAQELTEKFGGVTSYARSPGEGRWRNRDDVEHDDIVVLEVMMDAIDRTWWSDLRKRLMREFRQEDIVIRSQLMERLS